MNEVESIVSRLEKMLDTGTQKECVNLLSQLAMMKSDFPNKEVYQAIFKRMVDRLYLKVLHERGK